MNRSMFLRRVVGGVLAAGTLTTMGAGAAFAQGSTPLNNTPLSPGAAKKGPGAAQRGRPDNPGAASLRNRQAVSGVIESINTGAKSFVISTRHGNLTVTTNDATEYHAPRNENVNFATLAVGRVVMAQGERPNETALLAKRIMLRPEHAASQAQREDRRGGRRP